MKHWYSFQLGPTKTRVYAENRDEAYRKLIKSLPLERRKAFLENRIRQVEEDLKTPRDINERTGLIAERKNLEDYLQRLNMQVINKHQLTNKQK